MIEIFFAERFVSVAFKVYDMDRDGFISNGELFLVLKMMVGNNLKVSVPQPLQTNESVIVIRSQDSQLQEIVDKTIMEADKDGDGKLSFEEFTHMVANTVRPLHFCTTANIDYFPVGHRETNDT